jgi:hypothetical protein
MTKSNHLRVGVMASALILAAILLMALVVGQQVKPAQAQSSGDPSEETTASAAPIAAGQTSSQRQDLNKLAGEWWNWAVQNPSPLKGNYKGGPKCKGEFVEGVFFLAGTTGGTAERRCTVPDDTALFFPIVNAVCSKAFNDPTPYTKCADDLIDAALADGETFAKLDGKNLKGKRIASGPFTWTLPEDNVFGLPAGSYDAAADGLWVYLPQGLEPGEYTVQFGGDFFGGGFSLDVTYELVVV